MLNNIISTLSAITLGASIIVFFSSNRQTVSGQAEETSQTNHGVVSENLKKEHSWLNDNYNDVVGKYKESVKQLVKQFDALNQSDMSREAQLILDFDKSLFDDKFPVPGADRIHEVMDLGHFQETTKQALYQVLKYANGVRVAQMRMRGLYTKAIGQANTGG